MSLSYGSKLIGTISSFATNIITRVIDLFFASIVPSDDDGLVVGLVARDRHRLPAAKNNHGNHSACVFCEGFVPEEERPVFG